MNKGRYWTFVAYPESLEVNLVEFLTNLGLIFAISPLHDKDKELCLTEEDFNKPNLIEEGGQMYYYKKPHYHVILQFPGPTTFKCIKTEITDVLGQPIPKKVLTLRGAYRYLTHLDNPEKAQYSQKDIVKSEIFELPLTNTEVTTLKMFIIDEIEKLKIRSYLDLLNYYKMIGDFDRFDIVASNTFFFTSVFNSIKDKRISENKLPIIDRK